MNTPCAHVTGAQGDDQGVRSWTYCGQEAAEVLIVDKVLTRYLCSDHPPVYQAISTPELERLRGIEAAVHEFLHSWEQYFIWEGTPAEVAAVAALGAAVRVHHGR